MSMFDSVLTACIGIVVGLIVLLMLYEMFRVVGAPLFGIDLPRISISDLLKVIK